MKKIILLILIIIPAISFAQETPKSSSYYFQKSKHQKIAGWVLLGGGAVLTTISIMTDLSEGFNIDPFGTGSIPPPPDNSASPALAIAGVASMLGSIPFFISAHHNKKKGIALRLKEEKSFIPGFNNSRTTSYPALSFTVKL